MLTIAFGFQGVVRCITLIADNSFVQRLAKFGDIYDLGIGKRNGITTVHSCREETKPSKYHPRGILTQQYGYSV